MLHNRSVDTGTDQDLMNLVTLPLFLFSWPRKVCVSAKERVCLFVWVYMCVCVCVCVCCVCE